MDELHWLSRFTLIVGDEGIGKLQKSHVLVVGLGGVGSYAAEFICRAGIGEMTIVDGDVVDPTNRNRQLPALATTHGLSKAELMAERLLAINPALKLTVIKEFMTPEKCAELLENPFDYVMDCIDSITPKITLLTHAYAANLPIVSSMGAGGKLDPTHIKVADLNDTIVCPFAQTIRKRLKKIGGHKGIKAVFSSEDVIRASLMLTDGTNFKKSAYGTVSYLPAMFGGVAASVVVRDLLGVPIEMAKREGKFDKPKMRKPVVRRSVE